MVSLRRLLLFGALGLVAVGAASYAVAGPPDGPGDVGNSKHFKARLNGFQEVPSVSSTGWGNFDAKLVDENTIHYVFTYGGLEGGNSLFSHIHFGERAVNGGVVIFLCGGGTKPDACPNVEGTVEGDWTKADVVSSTGATNQGIEANSWDEFLRALRAGHGYVNIHTTRWAGGEIRGQINNEDQKQFDK